MVQFTNVLLLFESFSSFLFHDIFFSIDYLQPVWSEWTDPICFNDSSGCFIVRNRSCSAGIERHCNGRAIDIKVCGENDCKGTCLL